VPPIPGFGRALIAFLSVLPKHLLSRAAGALANRPVPRRLRARVYRGYSRVFGATPEEAELALDEYPTLNAFFTRALRPGLRPVAARAIVAPADAAVGAWGPVAGDTLVQAKGRNYSLKALLGDEALAHRMDGGTFATFYLAPKDYHRIHAPVDGLISAAAYIPGELWPVNAHAVAHVADLFSVNERIVIRVERPGAGVVAVALVGATMVGMTRLVFDDLHTNARRRELQRRTYDPAIPVRAGDPLGHFEFGSTVIVVCSPESGALEPREVGETVRVGERLGPLVDAGAAPRA
jgi:phosphatidylserine decarboxylase